MRLIQEMRRSIESYWDHLQTADPYNRSILEGTLQPEMLSHFLVNVHVLVQHTPIHLRLAEKICAEKGLDDLGSYYQLKFVEESGHDKWAEADMIRLKKQKKNVTIVGTTDKSMKDFLLHIEGLIRKDPYLYLPYIFFAEYLTVLYGPKMNKALIENCGYLPHSMTVIENHAELDKEHVNEWEDVIAEIVDEELYREPFLAVLSETIRLHKEFFLSCAERRLHAAS